MQNAVLLDLKRIQKRLEYYTQLKEKSGGNPPASLNKWIEIYLERMKKLEEQAQKLGLKAQTH